MWFVRKMEYEELNKYIMNAKIMRNWNLEIWNLMIWICQTETFTI